MIPLFEVTELSLGGGEVLRTAIRRAISAKAALDESLIRALLERWASELEPAVAYDQNGNIVGLTIANALLGSKPPILSVTILSEKEKT